MSGSSYGSSDGYGHPGGAGAYGSYGDRQLTESEQEEGDVQATKDDIKYIKQQSVSSTRDALRLAQQAEETGRQTLERLGGQGERLQNTERNLDLAAGQNGLAGEKARELKTLNKFMFAIPAYSPFASAKRREARILDTHRRERFERDATRAEAWSSKARKDAVSREMRGSTGASGGRNLAQRIQYQFEPDSDDERVEDEIDSNLDALHSAAGRLKRIADTMGREIDEQKGHVDRITNKADRVDDQLAMNRARFDRMK